MSENKKIIRGSYKKSRAPRKKFHYVPKPEYVPDKHTVVARYCDSKYRWKALDWVFCNSYLPLLYSEDHMQLNRSETISLILAKIERIRKRGLKFKPSEEAVIKKIPQMDFQAKDKDKKGFNPKTGCISITDLFSHL